MSVLCHGIVEVGCDFDALSLNLLNVHLPLEILLANRVVQLMILRGQVFLSERTLSDHLSL